MCDVGVLDPVWLWRGAESCRSEGVCCLQRRRFVRFALGACGIVVLVKAQFHHSSRSASTGVAATLAVLRVLCRFLGDATSALFAGVLRRKGRWP